MSTTIRGVTTAAVIGAFMILWKMLGIEEMVVSLAKKPLQQRYDYVIVGAGTAGSVFAGRLSEDEGKTILVLEAGGDPYDEPNVNTPIMADSVRFSSYDWQYHTVPQKHACYGHINNESYWALGKGLGGSSNLNYMQYLRGSRHDYDDWANNGAAGWAYKDVLPYFIKSEDQRNGEFIRTVFHGFGGRMTVSDVGPTTVNKIVDQCFKEVGLKKRDLNGQTPFGWCPTQATVRSGVRWSTYRAFLRRARHRDGVTILTQATVTKILFEGQQAVGVTFLHQGELKTVRANSEVVLAAGTVGTAKLLLLSGVGPRAHLNALKIPVVADLPVGENLQDQVIGDGVTFFTPFTGVSVTAVKAENFASAWSYSLFGTGMKSSPRFRESVANIKLRHQPPHIKYPLLSLHIASNPETYLAHQLNVRDDVWEAAHSNPPSREGFTIFPVLLHPRSRGTVRLRSNNPSDAPLIDPRYLADDVDVKILAEGYQFARRLINAKVMKEWDFQLSSRLLPQCAQHGNYTEQYIHCHLRHITLPGGSPVGTCRMGAAGDPAAVVDPLLRVRGVKGLRVIDASVIPTSTSGNSYTSQVMIAEKAADIVREKDTVKAIKEYFKHLLETKHKRIMEEDEHTAQSSETTTATTTTKKKR